MNVSPAAVITAAFHDLLAGSPGHRLVVELTEHRRVDDYQPLLRSLDALRQQAVRVAVDDAGAGYAGLQHILRLHPDIIKLDTDLTMGIDADPVRRALAASLVAFADDIGAILTAEGIEAPGEFNALRSLGIPWGQGYHLARPAPLPLSSLRHVAEPGRPGPSDPNGTG